MNHSQKIFTFINKNGEEVQFAAKRYSFNLEKKFLELIGKPAWDAYQKTGAVQVEITPAKCKKDFPHLLTPLSSLRQGEAAFTDIDFNETDISELAAVYFFFITFRQNVFTNHQLQLNETHALNLAQLAKISNLIPQDVWEKMNLMNTRSS